MLTSTPDQGLTLILTNVSNHRIPQMIRNPLLTDKIRDLGSATLFCKQWSLLSSRFKKGLSFLVPCWWFYGAGAGAGQLLRVETIPATFKLEHLSARAFNWFQNFHLWYGDQQHSRQEKSIFFCFSSLRVNYCSTTKFILIDTRFVYFLTA